MTKVLQKAYRASFTWSDCPMYHGQLIHADSAKQARSKYFNKSECEKDDFINIRVRRDKMFDLMENVPDGILSTLSPETIKLMGHTIGFDWYSIQPYRNHFAMAGPAKQPEFEQLIKLGLAEGWIRIGSQCYGLTQEGIRVIKTTRPIYRFHHEKVSLSEIR